MNNVEKMILSEEMGKEFEWDKWAKEIPAFTLPPGWKIQVIPPFTGAVVRYRIYPKNSTEVYSVYLDCYERLGIFGAPYWEVYPTNEGTARFPMTEAQAVIKEIQEEERRLKRF